MCDDEPASDKLPENLTIPKDLRLSAHGFIDDEYARTALYRIHSVLSVISEHIDISNLDGVTVSFDYEGSGACLEMAGVTCLKKVAKCQNGEASVGPSINHTSFEGSASTLRFGL